MSTNLKLQTAIHIALGVGAGALAASYAPLAVAQDQDAQEADEAAIEEVIVTGSRIKRADIDSASPITVLDRADIQATGLTDVGDLLQTMPSMSGSPIGTTTNNGGNGSVQIDLRGMGVNRTVTLINGHRTVDGGDYQTIPSTMIERVEILKDGASAVYGADAVAGVVNIITRRDFQGLEVSAQQADWFDAKGKQYSFGLISGFETERGNFVLGAEYVNQEEAYQSDTPWEFFQDSFYIYPQGCESQLLEPYPTGCYRGGSSRIPESRLGFVTQGTFLIGTPATEPYEVGLMIPHDGRNYNFAPVNYIQTPYERYNIFSEAHFDLTDKIRFNAEMRGNFRESAQELAAVPFNSPTDPAYQGVYNGLAYSGISEDNYYLRRAVDTYNAANPGANLVYEPVRDARRRFFEAPRRFTQDVTQWQAIAGLEGTMGEIDWDVFFNYGYRSRQDIDFGQYSSRRLAEALGPSADLDGDGMPECYGDINDPSSIIAGCVPLNLFGGGTVVRETGEIITRTVTQDMLDYVGVELNDSFLTKNKIWGGSVTGSLFELPGGALGWAAGYSYWKQEYRFQPDSLKALGEVTGNKGAGTNGTLTNNAVFVEVLAPFYDNGTQELVAKAGVRYDDYDLFSGDTTWQVGIEFQALDSLKFRGTVGTAFRAPNISELFGGEGDSFVTYSDPCADASPAPGCARQSIQLDSQVRARVGGNQNLTPETADTYTAGIVWTPSFGDHGISVTVDYWDIQLEDGISSLGVQNILDQCYEQLNQDACALIIRREDPEYSIAQIRNTNLNIAEQGANGIDTEIRWDYSSSFGQWRAALLWTHLMERTRTRFPGQPEEELSGRFTDYTATDGGMRPENKANFSLQWLWNDLSIAYLNEYIGGMDADTQFFGSDYTQDIDDEMYHDLVASYTLGQWGLTLTGGVTNLTDEPPPFVEIGFNAGTDPVGYRIFGRGYYVRAQWKF
jgi:outer membrane receptor protein involved in Fe transport